MQLRSNLLKYSLSLNILIGSTNSFLIQPIITKKLIFELGSSASIWNITIAYFTFLVLVGYFYATFISRFSIKNILITHGLLHLLYLIFIVADFLGYTHRQINFNNLNFETLYILTSQTLLLFLATAANSVVMQVVVQRFKNDINIFNLYRLSNMGSLVGLILFPIILEPLFSMHQIIYIMFGLYILFGLTYVFFLNLIKENIRNLKTITETKLEAGKFPYLILFLSLLSMLFMSVTSSYTNREISSLPLVWIIPLAIYLISFVIGFSENLYQKFRYLSVFACLFILSFLELNTFGFLKIFVINLELFIILLFLHKKIYTLRPINKSIGYFYAAIALGGSLGSIINAFVFPVIFNRFYEYAGVFTLCIITIYYFYVQEKNLLKNINIFFSRQSVITGALFLFIFGFLWYDFNKTDGNFTSSVRNFYGTASIQIFNGTKYLTHNATLHGAQIISDTSTPTTYYGANSGVNKLFSESSKNQSVLTIGLGVGTLNAYCPYFKHITYIDLDPKIIDIAQKDFDFIKSCESKTTIILGDGRKVLEKQINAANFEPFDVLIIDAFSGDNIPTHLLTNEAFDIYHQALKTDGQIAIHISSRYINLQNLIAQQSATKGYDLQIFDNKNHDINEFEKPSVWAIMQSKSEIANSPKSQNFTDEKNSLLPFINLYKLSK